MRAAAAKLLDVRLEAVDGSGLLPRAAIRDALDDPLAFRARFRRVLPPVAFAAVVEDPLAAPPPRVLERLPVEVADRWHPVRKALLDGDPDLLARFRVDAAVGPVALRGGETAAREAFAAAVRAPAAAFAPDLDAWIRFGHLSTEELARTLLLRDGRIASVDLVKDAVTDHGWWTPTAPVDRFLDHVVLRREHALHRAERRGRDGDRYPALAADVRARLERAALVPGRTLADVAALEAGTGPRPAWNALQHALRTEGRLPVGARWRWTRGLLEAAADPRDAFDLAVHLTHKFALDGRDPVAVAAIAEVFVDAVAPRGGKAPPAREGRAFDGAAGEGRSSGEGTRGPARAAGPCPWRASAAGPAEGGPSAAGTGEGNPGASAWRPGSSAARSRAAGPDAASSACPSACSSACSSEPFRTAEARRRPRRRTRRRTRRRRALTGAGPRRGARPRCIGVLTNGRRASRTRARGRDPRGPHAPPPASSPSCRRSVAASERDVAVLLRRVLVALRREVRERLDQLRPRVSFGSITSSR